MAIALPASNGERFLFNARLEEGQPRTINVVLDWPALLRPAGGEAPAGTTR